jgi:hypothetical protein
MSSVVEREVCYVANEMQLLEGSIHKFKKQLTALTGADNNATSRRKGAKAVWEETKEAAKKKVDTELLQGFGLLDWAQASNEQHAKRPSEHTVVKQATIYAVSAKLKPAKNFRSPLDTAR